LQYYKIALQILDSVYGLPTYNTAR